ncbi:MAG: hypothetical protein KAS32_18685 [Candidatus Peribacteraceae bacterium]|nr:hypothetical protein [Candidatus Peribacteraceae bacterium]
MALRINKNTFTDMLDLAKSEHLVDLAEATEIARLSAIAELEDNLDKAKNNKPFKKMIMTETPVDLSDQFKQTIKLLNKAKKDDAIILRIGTREVRLELL